MKFKIEEYLLIIVLITCLLSKYVIAEPVLHEPKSSPQELLPVVEQFITSKNIPIYEYFLEIANYAFVEQRWEYYYANKEGFYGRDFVIIIDDNDHSNIDLIY